MQALVRRIPWYRIVHPEVESNYLKKYNRKSLFIPENAFFRPDINNLHYHQTHIYGLFKTSGSLVKAAGYYGNTASVVSMVAEGKGCLLYTSDAADDLLCVDLGGRRFIKKKT